MRKTLAVFDFDGTLFFQTYQVNAYAMNKALKKRALPEMSHDQLVQSVGDTLPDIAARLIPNPKPDDIFSFCNDIIRYAADFIENQAECHPHVSNMIKGLHAAGVTLCICSNGAKDYLYPLLKKFGLLSYFHTVWYSKEGILKKDALNIIMHKFENHTVYMIGDRAEDINAGLTNKCVSIGIKSDLDAFSSSGVPDFNLSGADFIVTKHAEILSIILGEKGDMHI